MTSNRLLLLLVSFTALSGCATPFQDYEGTSQRVALANICERQGHISKEAFASYASFQFGGYASQWTVDQARLQSMYLTEVERSANWKPGTIRESEQLRLNCAQIATVAQRVAPNSSPPQPASPSNQYRPPQTTNCLTTNGWTRCTTN